MLEKILKSNRTIKYMAFYMLDMFVDNKNKLLDNFIMYLDDNNYDLFLINKIFNSNLTDADIYDIDIINYDNANINFKIIIDEFYYLFKDRKVVDYLSVDKNCTYCTFKLMDGSYLTASFSNDDPSYDVSGTFIDLYRTKKEEKIISYYKPI